MLPASHNHRQAWGLKGEQQVADYLQKQGFVIVERNFRTKSGEIDLIAQKKDILAFVEVKSRYKQHVPIAQMVPVSKQRKIIAVAKYYISTHTHQEASYRFDVAVVSGLPENEIVYISNAFQSHE